MLQEALVEIMTCLLQCGMVRGRRAANVVMTSRKPMTCGVHSEVEEDLVEIGPVSPQVAKQLLQKTCGSGQADDALLHKLAVEACKCNPLSIVMIGGFIRCRRVTMEVRIRQLGGTG
jgi:hypothetical protein